MWTVSCSAGRPITARRCWGRPTGGCSARGADVEPEAAVDLYRPYVGAELARGTRMASMTRHMLGLFQNRPGARSWRRILTVEGARPGAGLEVLDHGLEALRAASAKVAVPQAAAGSPQARSNDPHGAPTARLAVV